MKRLIYILILPIMFFSCKKEIYHSFTDEERAFLVYDKGDKFILKQESSNNLIELTVTEKKIRYTEDFGTTIGPSRKEHFMEQGDLTFSNTDGSCLGDFYIYKDKVDQFVLRIDIQCKGYNFGGGDVNYKVLASKEIEGVDYSNVYFFDGYHNEFYFSKKHGILKLVDVDSGETFIFQP